MSNLVYINEANTIKLHCWLSKVGQKRS